MAYEPTNWKTGDIVTSAKLNKLEKGVQDASSLVKITYSALKALRDGGNLVPGKQYRITDYVCTVANDDNARVEPHPYDIIVTADSESVLNENARAALRQGDTYYHVEGTTDAILEAWELKYCLDNDTSRFAWADTANGKGVVYWLKDDRENECWYDFKQIQFKRFKIMACEKVPRLVGKYTAQPADGMTVDEENPEWHFTFYGFAKSGEVIDNSVIPMEESGVFSNKIGRCFVLGEEALTNTLMLCYSTFGVGCNNNTFGVGCGSNTFGDMCGTNTFGDGCNNNTFGNSCYSNTFGVGCGGNTFGDGCENNTFGGGCGGNTFGGGCGGNTFGVGCNNNTFGVGCGSNTFGDGCGRNTFRDGCGVNTFGHACIFITVNNITYRYNVMSDVGGTQSVPLELAVTSNNKHTTYVGYDTEGNLKYWNPMDAAA